MMPSQKPSAYVLFIPHYSEAVLAFLNIAKALTNIGLTPLFLVSQNDQGTLAVCRENHLEVIEMPHFSWRHQLQSPAKFIDEPLRLRRFCQTLFNQVNIQALVLVDDRRFVELFMLREARKRGIYSLVVMWAATNTSQNMMQWRQKSLAHLNRSRWRFLRPLVRLAAPQAIRVVDGEQVYWQHPLAVLTLALFAQYPPHPWILGGGTADQVAVIGPYYRDLLISEGVCPEKVIVTGHPRHDDMLLEAKQWRTQTPAHPYILLAAPPIAHNQAGTRAGHVTPAQMHEYLHWVIEQLLELSLDLIVKPHPRDADAPLAYLDNHQRPFKVVRDQPIAPLIAGASLLVAQGSSVVYEACGLDVPTITFDFFKTPGYDMWSQVTLHIEDRTAFLAGVQSALFDPDVRSRLDEQRRRFVATHMILDGHSTERIIHLIAHQRQK